MKHALQSAPTTDLNDANPESVRRCTLPLQNFGAREVFAGRIRSVVTMNDTALVQQLIRTPGEGAVCVVDGGGSLRCAMLGDNYAAVMHNNGWAGIIVNGAVRDAAGLARVDVGIKALGVTPTRSDKHGIGAIDVPVAFGDVLFVPGQCVYCDADGVLVSEAPVFV